MPGARYLEKYLILALELDLFVIDPPRHIHRAIESDHRLGVEAVIVGSLWRRRARFRSRVSLCGRLCFRIRIESVGLGRICLLRHDHLAIFFSPSRHLISPVNTNITNAATF